MRSRLGAGVGVLLAVAAVLSSIISLRRWCTAGGAGSWILQRLQFVRSEDACIRMEQGSRKERGMDGVDGFGVGQGLMGAIGNTPLIRIHSLSDATGCEVLGKAEFLNPGGSVKDRVAAQIVEEALQTGALRVGGMITEGSAGSTGVSLAMVAAAHGCRCHVVLPDDAAIEKAQILQALGATVERVRPVSIAHKDHFVNVARRRAMEAEELFSHNLLPEPHLSIPITENPELGQDTRGNLEAMKQVDVVPKRAHMLTRHSSKELDTGFLKEDSLFRDSSGMGETRCTSQSGLEEQSPRGERWRECSFRSGLETYFQVDHTLVKEGLDGKSPNGCNRLKDESGVEQRLCASQTDVRRDGEECQRQIRGGFFADQFENLANFRAHYGGTAPEIWKQTGGKVDAFVAAAGTGGTIAGISRYLKEQNRDLKCYLIDPPGSGLFNRVTRGVMYTREEAEGKRMKNPFDTITEGIGINRITQNFKQAQLDGAFRGTDREAVEMARFLLKNDGLFLGSSSAMNCVGAVRVARLLGPGQTIVTILCDGGARHLSKFHNPGYLATHGLIPTATGLEFLDESSSALSVAKV